ncbi:hypothetical protein EYS09_01135 [Streptomyces kasugaensis]|uniref:Uncharacterized protein n=1 Tax=Streptomyces kasugaensis TaxID=1946 RepID=A0A4Q9I195_STRKA|nr:hypothetical protein [Streptomyces kasugaensis]TBO61458.1 hypothetical protein EYS09_01135 [Streptomyces kasugaensis]
MPKLPGCTIAEQDGSSASSGMKSTTRTLSGTFPTSASCLASRAVTRFGVQLAQRPQKRR